MLIVAFACFLSLFVVWLLVPTSDHAEVAAPASVSILAAEATGD